MLAFTRTTTMESVKHSAKGIVHEAQLYFCKPGYDLEDIHQPVRFWWGTEDNVVQYLHAEAIKKYVPNNEICIKEYEGHISIYVNYIEEILQAIRRSNG